MFAALFSCSKKMKEKKRNSKRKTRVRCAIFKPGKGIEKTHSNIWQERRQTGKRDRYMDGI